MSKPTGMDRRQALKSFSAIAAAPVLSLGGYHPLVPVQDGDAPWKPVFLTDSQHESVRALVELIIPRTETPGALDAKVDQFIDFITRNNKRWT